MTNLNSVLKSRDVTLPTKVHIVKAMVFPAVVYNSTFTGLPKNLPANAGDASLIPELGRSPGERNVYPFQYSCLENPMDRGAWQSTVPGVAKSQTQLTLSRK